MSYEMFGFISQKKIDKMRDSAKLEVSQVQLGLKTTTQLIYCDRTSLA